jgi:hypothetical protein
MAETTVAGLPLQVPDDLAQPLGAVVVIKGLARDDEVCYYILKTSDITRTEATGMLIMAADEFRASLAGLAREPGG